MKSSHAVLTFCAFTVLAPRMGLAQAQDANAGVGEPPAVVAPTEAEARNPEPAVPPTAEAPNPIAGTVDDYRDKSLEDILNMTVEVATKAATTVDEAPAVVSVITREDIEHYGLRTFADILHVIPGFAFGMDVIEQMGPSFRGIWVEEGKMLVMINGMIVNELGYGLSAQVVMLPTTLIERVEVIRGPGSALYGQFAEIAVINIITPDGADLSGMRVQGSLTAMDIKNTAYRGEASFGYRHKGFDASATIGTTIDPWSRREYHDFFGNSLQMGLENSRTSWNHIIAKASYAGLTLSYRRVNLKIAGQDGYTSITPRQNGINTETGNPSIDGAAIDYKITPVEHFTIEARAEVIQSDTAGHSVYPGEVIGFGITSVEYIQHFIYDLRLSYDFGVGGNLTVGGGYRREVLEGVDNTNFPALQVSDDPNGLVQFKQIDSKYALAQYSISIANTGLSVNLGGRLEGTYFGNALAPRAGIVFNRESFTAKVLYGHAYRIPTAWQAFSSQYKFPHLVPESADNYELELAYRFDQKWKMRVNGYYIDVAKPLIFNGGDNSYHNENHLRSSGLEAELIYRDSHFGGFLNASFAHPLKGTFAGYLAADGNSFMGIPTVKANLGAYYTLGIFDIAPSFTFFNGKVGQSSAYANAPAGSPFANTQYPAVFLANLSVRAKNILGSTFPGLDAEASAFNIFDAPYLLVQPYYGGHAPLPAFDRRFLLGLVWNLTV